MMLMLKMTSVVDVGQISLMPRPRLRHISGQIWRDGSWSDISQRTLRTLVLCLAFCWTRTLQLSLGYVICVDVFRTTVREQRLSQYNYISFDFLVNNYATSHLRSMKWYLRRDTDITNSYLELLPKQGSTQTLTQHVNRAGTTLQAQNRALGADTNTEICIWSLTRLRFSPHLMCAPIIPSIVLPPPPLN